MLCAVPSPKARESVTTRYRAAGFTPDDFEGRRAAREAAADALARTEDLLELGCFGRVRERQVVRAVRRALENELWTR